MIDFSILQRDVIDIGLCTGCGTCFGVCPTKAIGFDNELEKPVLVESCNGCGLCYKICPGIDVPLPKLDQMIFGRHRSTKKEMQLGLFRDFYKCCAVDPAVREIGASGGVASALLLYALETDIIDCAIVVGMNEAKPWRAEPKIAKTKLEILNCAKSKYAIVPINALLSEVSGKEFDKLGVVGLPCHIEAIRKMQMHGEPATVVKKVKIVIGLFCGRNQSYKATEHLLLELCGIPNLNCITKLHYRSGTEFPKNLKVWTKDGSNVDINYYDYSPFLSNTVGTRERCSVCYDYASELADISIGDFVQSATKRREGAFSLVAVRTEMGEKIFKDAMDARYIRGFSVSENVALQSLGFEIKKHGCAFNLIQRKEYGWPVPNFHYPISVT